MQKERKVCGRSVNVWIQTVHLGDYSSFNLKLWLEQRIGVEMTDEIGWVGQGQIMEAHTHEFPFFQWTMRIW